MTLAIATAISDADSPNYLVQIDAGTHSLLGDEGPREGGQDSGPAPFEFVLSGLAACTAATLRMYMQKKAWPGERIKVATELHIERDGGQYIRRTVSVEGPLGDSQRTRLAEICEKTPVTLFIKRGTRIDTAMQW
ncbi:putative redox protein [Paraburkholderia sp. BL23I1N1]|uniref:OsmC family protein n=1 Tax=Paraburkholderia sp. BL23I1N1 TaxID=1938802 RepID=UPI000E718309|nr:OsmC family protein [Paraburkholderia sp. BL23I1N1]RKE38516.1 putative redox protein [Paraburkholderia sp. BL23I1N1]